MKTWTRLFATLMTLVMLCAAVPLAALAEEQPTEVIFYFLGEELEDDKVVLAAINEKLKEKLNCYMTVSYVPFGEVNTTYPLLLASQTEMDAIFSAYFTGYGTLAAKNAFMEMTEDMLKTYAPITWEHTPQEVWDQAKVNGKIYMVPQEMIQNIQATVGIRGDLREKYGIPEVTDVASLETYMAAVHENESGIAPLLIGGTLNVSYLDDILMLTCHEWAADANFPQTCMVYDLMEEEPVTFCYLYTDEFRERCEIAYRWNQNGWISKDSLSNTNTNRENMANGKTAVMMDNAGTINAANEDLKKNGTGEFVEIADFSGDNHMLRYAATGGGISLPINSRHPELVLQIIDYLRNDKEMNYLVQRGIYGEDAQWYFAGELNEDGTLNENVIAAGERSQLYGGNWICWSAFRNWDYQTIEAEQNCIPGYRDIFYDMDARSVNNILQSFTFDSSQYQSELATLQNVYEQYGKPLRLGFVDPATGVDEYIQMMEAAGLQTVINAYVEQAAAYIEANK